MKLKKYRLGIALTAILTTSYMACRKALDIPPPTQSEASYFTKESDYRTAIIGVYASLTDFYSTSSSSGGSGDAELQSFYLPGDDLTINTSNPFEIFGGSINPANGDIDHFYKSNYIMIGRANKVLQKLETAPAGVFTTANLQSYIKGEALFLRAFGEYQLWNAFGTAPVVTKVVTSLNDVNVPSSKGTELLDQAVKDLTDASTMLPTSWTGGDIGRVTAKGAYGMLGKVLVFRATVNKSTADYQAAIAAFNKISGASLVDNFEDNFDYQKENNSESLFEFQAGADLNSPGSTNAWLANDQCDCGVASAYYQMFIPDGPGTYMGGGMYTPTNKLKNAFEPADPRLHYTMKDDKSAIIKYVLHDSNDGAVNSINNYRILRYADVLLLKAEATLQSGGSISDAMGYVNQVRARARKMVAGGTIPADFNAALFDKTTAMQAVMDERLRELAAEGGRWWDLRRWHLGGVITLNNAFFNSITPGNMAFDAHFLYYPIPSSERNVNANVGQNPGY